MITRYAPRYIDSLFATKQYGELHQVIDVIAQSRPLPEEFWLYCRMCEWAHSSPVRKYYRRLDVEFERNCLALDRFGLAEIAEWYRLGRDWHGKGKAKSVDVWLADHDGEIEAAVFPLIAPLKDVLKA
jgi:hypothetical protein